MSNDGKEAEAAFVKHWERVGHLERLRDKRDLMGLNKGLRLADFKKPADFMVSSRTTALHYAEVKSTTHPTTFAFSKIQDGQSKAALLEASRGARAYYFYIFSYELGEWFVMPCWQYANILNEGRRSVKFEELDKWQR